MLRAGRGSVRAGVGASSTAQVELRPTVILRRMEAFNHYPQSESRRFILQLLNSCNS